MLFTTASAPRSSCTLDVNPGTAHIQIHWPASIGSAGVHVQRENEMFNWLPLDHGIEKKRPRGEIDDGSANNANGIDISARKT